MATPVSLHSTLPARVDVLRSDRATVATQAFAVVFFALLTAVGAQFRIYLWEVPFTLQTVAVYGSGLFLGGRNGALAQLLYLTVGLFLPVFAGEGSGPAYLFGAVSAGYLLAYPLAAFAAGRLSRRWNSLPGTLLSMAAASLVIFTAGVSWLHYAAGHESWLTSIERGWLRFIPADVAKMMLVALAYSGARRLTRRTP